MRELISVAQVGRSLGVHLILATQKPSGTVDDNIWSNSKFRLCLRVQDREDSMDMLRKPDAAYITQAGRCYLQVGSDEVYELFQSGWSGAPYDETQGAGSAEPVRLLTLTGKTDIVGGRAKRAAKKSASRERTQLEAVIEHLADIAREDGYAKIHRLWMPVLPKYLYLSSLSEHFASFRKDDAWPEPEKNWDLDTIIGLFDDPADQAQIPLRISFSEGGHLAVIGSVVSGKSTFLQTLLYALTMKYTPQYLNIYGIDFSSKTMSAMERAPHVGGVAYEGEEERISKLFHMLDEILEERKRLLRGGNYSQYVQVHGVTLPAILLVIDNFSAFQEKTENRYEKQIITISKEGVSHGIFLVISAGGFSMSELPGRIAENMKTAVCLEMPDKFAYGDVLHTMRISVLPETGIKGRGLAWHDGQLLEFQTALALEAEDDYQRMERIFETCEQMDRSWRGKRAVRIPEIPQKPVWEEYAQLEKVQNIFREGRQLPVGYDEESADIYSIRLSEIFCYLITGAARTGKRNFMKVMIQAARGIGAEIYVADAGNDMNIFSTCGDVAFLRDTQELFQFFMNTLTPLFQERNQVKRELEQAGAEEEELQAAAQKQRPVFLFLPDFPWFAEQVYQDDRGMSGFMETLVKKGRFHNIYFIANLPLENRSDLMGYQMFHDFVSYRTGIHFGGNVSANPLMNFDYLGYQKQSEILKPGIGLLPDAAGEQDTRRLVVPLAKWRKTESL